MNVSAFIEYLNKTKHLQLDADYYGNIEVWRQWWKGDVPDIHDQKEDAPDGSVISRRLASLRMPKHVCEDWANLLLNDKTTFQIGDAKSAAYLLGSDEQQTGGLLRQLHFWENANKLVEQASCPHQLTGYEYEVLETADCIARGVLECPSMPHHETIHMMEVMDHLRAQMGIVYPCEGLD